MNPSMDDVTRRLRSSLRNFYRNWYSNHDRLLADVAVIAWIVFFFWLSVLAK